jgi:hypothetical protein
MNNLLGSFVDLGNHSFYTLDLSLREWYSRYKISLRLSINLESNSVYFPIGATFSIRLQTLKKQ